MEKKETNGGGNEPQQPVQPNQPNRPNGKKRFNLMWIYAILAIALIAVNFFGRGSAVPQEEIDQGKLKELLQNQEISKIELINKEDAEIYLNEKGLSKYFPDAPTAGGTTARPNYTYKIGSLDRFEEMVETSQEGISNPVYISNVRRSNWMSDIMAWVLPFVLLIVFYIILMRGMGRNMGGGGSVFNIGKSRAQLYDKNSNSVNVTFKDVAGLEEAKVEIMEVVDFLKNPEKYTKLGGKIPKGVLLVGPPGTGKTLLAKSVVAKPTCLSSASRVPTLWRCLSVWALRVCAICSATPRPSRLASSSSTKSTPSVVRVERVPSLVATTSAKAPSTSC